MSHSIFVKRPLGVLGLALATSAICAPALAKSYKRFGDFVREAHFVCELPKTIVATTYDADTVDEYTSFDKANFASGLYLSGPAADCGAGSCYWTFENGAYTYRVRQSRATGGGFDIDGGEVEVRKAGALLSRESCRSIPNAFVQCLTKDFAAYAIRNPSTGALSYQAFDYSKSPLAPTLVLKGGTAKYGTYSGLAQYEFKNGTYRYVIETTPSADAGGDGTASARLVVKNGSRTLVNQPCEAFQLGYGAL